MIPDIKELNFPKIDGKQYATLTHATPKLDDMGEKNITTQVKIDGEIVPDFSFDWEVEFQGEKYIMPLRIPQGAKENTSLNSTIDLTFQHWAIYQLKRWPFVTIQQIAAGTYLPDEEEATVQLNLKDFCILFGQVLEYYYGEAITIDLNPAWQYKQEATIITISHTKIWNVLIDAFHDKYGVRWEIKAASGNSNTVKGGERYVIRVGYPTTEVDHIFEYGFEGGLLKVERQVQSEEIRNMLKGRGGETNMPFRYFKNTDPNNPDFRPDPDWVEELANIYFPNLMPATFRSYVQGWKAAHINQTDADGKKIYAGYTPVGEDNAYAPWAYRKGYTDTKFAPVEFVADEITINPTTDDKQVEILPGYSPYVKKGSSLDKYGPLPDTLDNNDDIYPTLQGTGLDIAVAVEQIESDDVVDSVESDAKITDYPGASATQQCNFFQGDPTSFAITVEGSPIFVPENQYADLDIITPEVKAYRKRTALLPDHIFLDASEYELVSYNIVVSDPSGNTIPASGIPSGHYTFRVVFNIRYKNPEILPFRTFLFTASFGGAKLMTATASGGQWTNTFDIWVKNIWDSTRLSGEADAQYSQRVWKPVLGDREGETAKVMFTTGALVHEDYEFTIVDFPVPDTSKAWTDGEGITHSSHWRIKLAKSDAELEATGLYVPSTKKQGKAGDRFVFIGTEMTHVPYVVDAEERIDDWKKDQLGEKKEIKPTAVVTTDRVRLNNEGKPDALINQLRIGNSLRLFDRRFFNEPGKAYETLYLQSITYTYREPTSEDAALNPDVEIVLGTEYTTSANPVSMMQGEISALQKQVGSISNIQQIVRAVGDRLYLRKDGISDRSLSPTQFFSLLTSGEFRAGIVGGAGWGFYKDENGNWVLETDRIKARQDLEVNNLVINQVSARGGMEIDTAAYLTITKVVEKQLEYVCYFDQKDGSVANLFKVGDVAMSMVYNEKWETGSDVVKSYRRRVTGVAADSVSLTKEREGSDRPSWWIDNGVNGSGVPSVGDVIVHFGNYNEVERQYVKVRDVVGGGYERYIENLNSVNAVGTEYFFVGRQAGMYGNRPRWYIGDENGFIEWVNGELNIKGKLSVQSTIGNTNIATYISNAAQSAADAAKEELQKQIDGVIEAFNGQGAPTLTNYPANEWTTDEERKRHDRDVYTDITPYVDDATTPTSGQSWRWYYNSPTDYGWIKIADSDAVRALQLAQMSVRDTDVLFISHTSETSSPTLPAVNASGAITDLKGWQTTSPAWSKDKYIWQTTYVLKGDGSASFTDPTCISGRNGNGIASIKEQYYLSTSRDTPTGSTAGWTYKDNREQWTAGKYWWTRSEITYTNGSVEYTDGICVTGEAGADGTSVYARYSSDGANWHPTPTESDIYIQTSTDGVSWSPAMRFFGSSYTENLMLNTEKRIGQLVTSNGDHYQQWHDRTVQMEQGQTYTISARTTAEAFTDVHLASIGLSRCTLWLCSSADAPQGLVNHIVSGTDMATDGSKGHTFVWNYPTGEYFLRTNFYTAGIWFVEKIKVEQGRNPSPVWTPNSSEMIGKDGQWTKNQWAKNNSSTTAPTAGWQDTPMTASAGEYVWIRSGIVVPPATEPTKYGEAVRLTGDKGVDGSDVYRLDLDNEMAAVAVRPNGGLDSNSVLPTANASVYKGATKLTSGVVFSIPQYDGVAGVSISPEGKVQVLGTVMSDVARITVQAVVDGVTLTTIMTVYKVKPGHDGQSVSVDKGLSSVTYQTSTNYNTPPTGQWLTAVPSVPNGHYLWTRTIVAYTDGTSTTAYSVARQGVNGDNGTDGDSYTNNILRNTDFKDGSRHFDFIPQGVTAVDTSRIFQGRYSVKSTQSGVSSQKPCGWIYGEPNEYIPAKPGDVITLSCWSCTDDPDGIDGNVIAEIYWRDANKQRISTSTYNHASFKPAGPGTWRLCRLTSDVAPAGTAYVELRCQLTQNGTVWFNGIKAEYGSNDSPVWTPFAEGTSLTSESVRYAKSSTASQPSDSAFTATSIGDLGLQAGDYMWSKTELLYSDGTVTKSYAVSRIGTDGTNGTPGAPGKDGKTTYVHLAYASGITGSLPHPASVTGFSTTAFAGAKYLGVCTDYNEADPDTNVEAAYEWSDYKGEAAVVYEIIPSVDVIKRSMTGELSDSSVSCSVYKVTGDTGRVPTAEKTLKYTRLPDGATGSLAHDGGSSAAVAVLSDTEAVVFELYDGSTLLDRERVVVLSDASDLEVGGTNLLRRSSATIERTYDAYGDHWVALADRTIHMEQGKVYTISAQSNAEFIDASKHGNVNDGVLGDWVSLWIVSPSDVTENRVNELVTGTDMASDGSKGHTFKWTRPTGDYVLRVNFYAPGTWWVRKIMIERGNVATSWSPSPEDFDYLTAAMQENTTITGGIVMSSMVKLGYTMDNNRYRIMSGMNGLGDQSSALAFWAGGDAYPPNTDEAVEANTTFGVRMDGTGYMAGGVIRFNKTNISIALPTDSGTENEVILDNGGLHLMIDNEERLLVGDFKLSEDVLDQIAPKIDISLSSVGDNVAVTFFGDGFNLATDSETEMDAQAIDDTITIQPIDPIKPIVMKRYSVTGGFSRTVWSSGTETIRKGAVISVNANFSINANLDSLDEAGVSGPTFTFYVALLKNGVEYRRWTSIAARRQYPSRIYNAVIKTTESISEDATYSLVIGLEREEPPASYSQTLTAYSSVNGVVTKATSTKSILGNNGLASLWDSVLFLANGDGVIARAGDFGIKVTPTGIKYTKTNGSDGWPSLV